MRYDRDTLNEVAEAINRRVMCDPRYCYTAQMEGKHYCAACERSNHRMIHAIIEMLESEEGYFGDDRRQSYSDD